MRNLLILFQISCIVFVTFLFASTTLGDEQSQEIQNVFERATRESRKLGKIAAAKKNSRAKKKRKNNRNKGGKYRKKPASFHSQSKPKKKTKNSKTFKHNKSNKNGCFRQPTNYCPFLQAFTLNHLYNQVFNFKKQLNRTIKQANLVQNKRQKKDNFQKDVTILTKVVGGDLRNPTCSSNSGSASSAGSTGLDLAKCNTTIAASCETITINSTLTGKCLKTMNTFEKKVEDCRDNGTCTCWTEAYNMRNDISKCSMVEEARNVKNKKKTCLDTFKVCKDAQDSAVEYTAICQSKSSSTTAMSTATTIKSAMRKRIVDTFLARYLMRNNHHNSAKA